MKHDTVQCAMLVAASLQAGRRPKMHRDSESAYAEPLAAAIPICSKLHPLATGLAKDQLVCSLGGVQSAAHVARETEQLEELILLPERVCFQALLTFLSRGVYKTGPT